MESSHENRAEQGGPHGCSASEGALHGSGAGEAGFDWPGGDSGPGTAVLARARPSAARTPAGQNGSQSFWADYRLWGLGR
jgi:hypothetical protein